MRDALQQAVMLSALALEVMGNKGVVAERRSQHGETLTFGWEGPVSDPDRLVLRGRCGSSPAAFQMRVLPSWTRIRARSPRAVLRASYKARVLSGKATM